MTASELLTSAAQPGPLPMSIPVHRSALGQWCADLGFTRGAEIGVWEGAFSETLCQQAPGLHLICVDPWTSLHDYLERKNDPARMGKAYKVTRRRLAPYACTFLRMTSIEAAAQVPDCSLDFVYLDGNHQLAHVLADLAAWVPKVRAGGIVAGHDYRARDKDKSFIQVKPAVDQYTREHGIEPWFVLTGDKSASFAWVKA